MADVEDPVLDVSLGTELPEKATYLSDLLQEKLRTVAAPVNQKLYDSLPVGEGEFTKNSWLQARELKLKGQDDKLETDMFLSGLTKEDIVNWLCGYTDLEKRAEESFWNSPQYWAYR